MTAYTPYYKKNKITLYNGDCRAIIPTLSLPCESIDMILTDPPYGMGRFKTDGKDYLEAVGPALKMAWKLLKNRGSMFIFTSTSEIVSVSNAIKLNPKKVFWMYKPNKCGYPHHGWISKSEAILWFVKGDKPDLQERRPFSHDTYIIKNVGKEGVEGHPTVKPLSVVSDLVSRCPVNGLILDAFCGSGTTLVACKNLDRKGIGIEIEHDYCKIVVQRLAQEVLSLGV